MNETCNEIILFCKFEVCIMTKIFYFLDLIFMFLYENRKKCPLVTNFSSVCLRHVKLSNFTSCGIQYRERWETGNSIAVHVSSIQDLNFHGFPILSCFIGVRIQHSYSLNFIHTVSFFLCT